MTSDFPIPSWGRARCRLGVPQMTENRRGRRQRGPRCGHSFGASFHSGTEQLPRVGLRVCLSPGARKALSADPKNQARQAPRRGAPPASPPPRKRGGAQAGSPPPHTCGHHRGFCHLSSVDCLAGTIRDPRKTGEAHPQGSLSAKGRTQRLQQQMLVRLVGNLPGGPLSVLPTNSARS